VGITIRQKSHIKVAKKQKMSSHEARYPGNVGFTIRQKLHFRAKNEKSLLTLNGVPFNRLFHDSTQIAFSGRQVGVVYVLSLEPVERSSVRVTCWYRQNKSGKV